MGQGREGEQHMRGPHGARTALRPFVECVSCKHVRSDLHVGRGAGCGHVVCVSCLAARPHSCAKCGKRFGRPPLPVDALTRAVLVHVFGRTPRDAAQLRSGVVYEMRARGAEVRVVNYEAALGAELDAAENDPARLTRCRCGLVCVQRAAKRDGRAFYGCPAWTRAGDGCKFFAWCSKRQVAGAGAGAKSDGDNYKGVVPALGDGRGAKEHAGASGEGAE